MQWIYTWERLPFSRCQPPAAPVLFLRHEPNVRITTAAAPTIQQCNGPREHAKAIAEKKNGENMCCEQTVCVCAWMCGGNAIYNDHALDEKVSTLTAHFSRMSYALHNHPVNDARWPKNAHDAFLCPFFFCHYYFGSCRSPIAVHFRFLCFFPFFSSV